MLFETAWFGFIVSIGLVLKGSGGIEEGRRYLAVQTSQGSGIYLELASLLEGTGGSSNSFASCGFIGLNPTRNLTSSFPCYLITPSV